MSWMECFDIKSALLVCSMLTLSVLGTYLNSRYCENVQLEYFTMVRLLLRYGSRRALCGLLILRVVVSRDSVRDLFGFKNKH